MPDRPWRSPASGATQIFVFASYVILVIVFGVITGKQEGPDLIPNTTVLLVAAGTVGVAALLLAIPATRRAIRSRVIAHAVHHLAPAA